MPYSIRMRMRDGMEVHCVVKDQTGETMGCHGTHADAQRQQAALYAKERTNLMDPVRR